MSSRNVFMVKREKFFRGIIKEDYLVIILGRFFLFLHKKICCGYSLEVPHQGTSNEDTYLFMEN